MSICTENDDEKVWNTERQLLTFCFSDFLLLPYPYTCFESY